MGGLLDLLFFGLLLWFIFRAAGRASEGRRQRSEGRTEAGETGQRSTPVAESPLRRRLMEELRRWEAEQQGRQVGRRETAEASRVPAERELEPIAWEAESLETIPPVEAESLETIPPVEAWSLEIDRSDAGAASGTAAAPASESAPRPDFGSSAVLRRSRRPGARLPDLSRYTPTQRAVLWAEILGSRPGLWEAGPRRD